MRAEAVLEQEVGWLTDVGIDEVNFEFLNENGYRDVFTCAMDDELDEDKPLAYFYALNCNGFLLGSCWCW